MTYPKMVQQGKRVLITFLYSTSVHCADLTNVWNNSPTTPNRLSQVYEMQYYNKASLNSLHILKFSIWFLRSRTLVELTTATHAKAFSSLAFLQSIAPINPLIVPVAPVD